MTHEQARIALQRIDREYLEPTGVEPQADAEATSIAHLRYMCHEASRLDFSVHKCMRWLGYVQAGLRYSKIASLDELKRLSMEISQ